MAKAIPLEVIEACRKDYIEGRGSVPDIAGRYGVSQATLKAKATGQGWTHDRVEYHRRKRSTP